MGLPDGREFGFYYLAFKCEDEIESYIWQGGDSAKLFKPL